MNSVATVAHILALCCYAASAATISIQPPVSEIYPGNLTGVSVNVTGASDLFAFQFDVVFTPSILEAVRVNEGLLFYGRGSSFYPGFIDNTAGRIQFIAGSLSGPGPGISADGGLAGINFRTIRPWPGTATVQVSNIVLLDSNLVEIPATATGGTFTLVPEPATFGMFSAALGLIGLVAGVRRRRSG